MAGKHESLRTCHKVGEVIFHSDEDEIFVNSVANFPKYNMTIIQLYSLVYKHVKNLFTIYEERQYFW